MNIQQENKAELGRFYYKEGNQELAEMDYRWVRKDLMSIDHTEVAPELEGKGIGKALIEAAVEKARADGYKILPLCPFVKKVFDKSPDKFKDILGEE